MALNLAIIKYHKKIISKLLLVCEKLVYVGFTYKKKSSTKYINLYIKLIKFINFQIKTNYTLNYWIAHKLESSQVNYILNGDF